ncbi:ABC transporter ATP-binding protein [Paenibacillus tengchongensis]|uniref:ABC transporter ATP-binding protein n=1 Tax=Paenibacillus tengchongensis TaxID=2608684 RepID=UPI001FE505C9|nr:ABC transporter ATP-binding protein [Paenibacillus tengchongensis]
MANHILELRGVSFTYPGSETPVLQDVSLSLTEGDFVAVIGGNGSGKSTLCKTFNGLIPHYYTGEFAGEIILNGQSAEGKTVSQLSRHIGYVYQDFENQLVRPTVLDDACFTPLNYGLADYRQRGERALELTGLTGKRHDFIWQLSGGQKHLLALAGALAMDPDILVIDEPISQLDPQHARHIYDILRGLNERLGKTVVVIEHHTEFIAEYCRSVVLMDGGRLRWQRPVREALSAVDELLPLGIYPPDVTRAAWMLRPGAPAGTLHPLSCEEAEGRFVRRDAGEAAQGIKRAGAQTTERRIGYMEERQAGLVQENQGGHAAEQSAKGAEEQASEHGLKGAGNHPAERTVLRSQPDSAPAMAGGQAPVVVMNKAGLAYRTIHKTVQPVLREVSLTLQAGECVALVGNNGAGKSSLMKLIAGIAQPTAGTVTVKGITVNGQPPERLAGTAAYVFQNPEDMFIDDSVRGEVSYYLKARKRADMAGTVERILAAFRLEELAERDARLLSGGQQRRVSLAIGAAMAPAVMLLDEPTANLDISTKQEMIGVLHTLRSHVETVVIATHDMALVAEWATRVIVMHEGRIIADGSKEEVFADALLLRRAGLTETQLMRLSRRLGLPQICCSLEEFTEAVVWKEAMELKHEEEGVALSGSR